MKKILALLLAMTMAMVLITGCGESEEDKGGEKDKPGSNLIKIAFDIPYGAPTVDGVIGEDEYQVRRVMDDGSCSAWVGEVANSVTEIYFAWDETGLYYAASINDTTPSYRDENSFWVGIDCIELAINPGRLLSGEKAEGIFFSFGAMENGKIIGYRHNFMDGLVSDEITGKATGHTAGTDGYVVEVMIPWSLVKIDAACSVGGKQDITIDSTGFVPEEGSIIGLLPCVIDADESGTILGAYKFNDTDFICDKFLNVKLVK